MASVEHFEIPADDMNRASAFYSAVFGFRYEPWSDDMGMLMTGSDSGINGDLHQRAATPHPTVVITVDNLEETIAAVVANGGEAIGSIQPLDEKSRWSYVRDSEGNLIGIFDTTAAPTDPTH